MALPEAPKAYLDFLAATDGGDGELQTAAPITYLRMWAAAASIEANALYQIAQHLSDHWGIGDNGGGEMLVFDRSIDGWPLYVVHATSLIAADRIPVAASFEELLGRIGKKPGPHAT